MHLVPFCHEWSGSETKLDLKGIYHRAGEPGTLTSPLPLRRHNDWMRKGFEFVTLASLEDLGMVAKFLQGNKGLDPLPMRDCYDMRTGAFKTQEYCASLGPAEEPEPVAKRGPGRPAKVVEALA